MLPRAEQNLAERYTRPEGWVYMTGMQALVRLPLQQRALDAAKGWNTGGYISGYRGSPMGRYDMELWQADDLLKAQNIIFRAGLNEDLAATAIWGAQHVGSFPGAKVEGVFGIWYGKGPGVDRSGDALRHANLAGTSPKGGVVCLAGDDHGAKSSTVANFSDQIFIAVGMPLLYPSNTQELLDYGLHGIAMSRFSGLWVGMKVVTDVAEGGGSVYVSPTSPAITLPEPPTKAMGPMGPGYQIRPFDMALPQEERLYHHKHLAALAYARANGLNRITLNPPGAKVGVISAGKAWQDVLQALGTLGLDDAKAEAMGVRLMKVGMIWPLDPALVREFAQGLDTLIVVEEKRPILEDQVRQALYGIDRAPKLIGKHASGGPFDPDAGAMVFPNAGELSPGLVAKVLADALRAHNPSWNLPEVALPAPTPMALPGTGRSPSFCSGCPHNRSTKVIAGSRALAGIGCHTMAMMINPMQTTTLSHMGAEGVQWLGQQPFTSEPHVFANIGDGTFAHSGLLAIRQAVAAHVPMTYKLLYNGFVSMTGGQKVEGDLSPAQIMHVLAGEGVGKLAIVTDERDKYAGVALPAGVRVHHRTEMEEVQKDFRDYPDVSVILYDQPCATERRRLRKRGKWADPDKRTFINPAVCEGCGDCGTVSNCMSIEPLETEFGRKRKINQSSCNKDFSCIEGFCPSFVTVQGGRLRKPPQQAPVALSAALPEPAIPSLERAFSILIGGIGGTGVVTIGQTLAVAAHLDGHYSSNLDVTGLAQKYGAVTSHVRIAPQPGQLHATRIAAGEADTLIGCDLIVSAGDEALSRLSPAAKGVIATDLVPTTEFARNPDWKADIAGMVAKLKAKLGERGLFLDSQRLSKALMGDAILANMVLLGAAWQLGQIPLSKAAIDRAIELNGVAIAQNKLAFLLGRHAAVDLEAVEQEAAQRGGTNVVALNAPLPLDDFIARRAALLSDHTGLALAARYTALVNKVRAAEQKLGSETLTRAVATYFHKLLAVKDEWEVARLYSHPDFTAALNKEFEGSYTLHMHLGAWPFARPDPTTGKLAKAELGPWALKAMRLMARFKSLRGTWLDPFRNNDERALDRQLIGQYEADITAALASLDKATLPAMLRLASVPEQIRGYGPIRAAKAEAAAKSRAAALADIERITKAAAKAA